MDALFRGSIVVETAPLWKEKKAAARRFGGPAAGRRCGDQDQQDGRPHQVQIAGYRLREVARVVRRRERKEDAL